MCLRVGANVLYAHSGHGAAQEVHKTKWTKKPIKTKDVIILIKLQWQLNKFNESLVKANVGNGEH